MATLQQLEAALKNADAAGDMDAARKLSIAVVNARKDMANQIPDTQVPGTIVQPPEPTLAEQAVGAGETGLALATGATGGMVGMIGGTLKGLAEQILAGQFGTPQAANLVEQSAMKGAQALTYAPRTQAGQEMTETTAKALAQAIPVTPLTAEMAAISAGTRAAMPAVQATAQRAAAPVQAAATKVAETVKQAMPGAEVPKGPTPGTMASGGAAAVDIADLRQAKAGELPVPIKLTEGQKTRSFEQQRFERETAKLPETGEPLRERFAVQNRQLQQNMDAFIDMTGAEAPDLRSVGLTVDKALRERAARDKTKIRTLYKDAEKAGELEQPVTLGNVVQHLTESAPEAEVANVLKAVRAKALQLGVAAEDASGNLVPQPVTLKTAELFRRSINGATNAEPTNIRQAAIMKQLVDGDTEGLGGNLYKQARRARTEYAGNYENIGLVKQLLGLKRGTDDRAIALEDVLRRSIIDPSTSLDTVKQVRRLLQTGGENGMQAWKELQGGTLRHIKDEALKNVAPDQLGNRVMSPAQLDRVIMQLDKNGKLDYVFGKKGAEQLRTINDVAKDVLTAPAGAVNTSNTATVLAGLMDVAISGTTGVPAPIMTSFRVITNSIRDAKLRKRVKTALGE
jgi:hypothetical protein